MPITLLDIVLILVMLVSGLLAMVRGFMREVLSITAWILAAVATLYSYGKLLPYAKQYFNSDIVAAVAVVGSVFLLTLLVVSVFTIRVSDMVLDSRVGALDRTMGFIFGLARGFLLVAIVFILFSALARDQPTWITEARSYPILKQTQVAIESLLPANPEQYLPGSKKEGAPEGQPGAPGTEPAAPSDAAPAAPTAPDQRSEAPSPVRTVAWTRIEALAKVPI